MIYFILFSVTVFLAMCADNCGKQRRMDISPYNHKSFGRFWVLDKRRLCCFAICIVYIVIVGCRNLSVGSDSGNYYSYLKVGSVAPISDFLTFYRDGDFGFFLYTWIIGRFTTSYTIYFVLFAFFYFSIVMRFVEEYSENLGISVWLFNALGLATFAMSTLRQATSMAFCLLAYMARNKRQKRAWLLFILGISFHISALAFLPMMFIDFVKKHRLLRTWNATAILIAVVVMSPYIMQFLKMRVFGDKYGMTTVGGMGMIAFLFLLCFAGWYYLIKLKREELNARDLDFLIGIFLALIIFIVTRFNLASMRTYYCYLMLTIVMIPNLGKRMGIVNRNIFLTFFIMISAIFLKTTVFIDPVASKLLPYSFFWE